MTLLSSFKFIQHLVTIIRNCAKFAHHKKKIPNLSVLFVQIHLFRCNKIVTICNILQNNLSILSPVKSY